MTKMIYITSTRLPTEKAHGLATMKIAEALARQGYELEMLAPQRFNPIKEDPFMYYNVEKNFKLTIVPSIDLLSFKILNGLFFYINVFSFILGSLIYLFMAQGLRWRHSIFFSHDHIPLYFINLFGAPIFFDVHDFPSDTFFYRKVLRKSFGLAVQTEWKISALGERFGVPSGKIVYWPNGTDVAFFG